MNTNVKNANKIQRLCKRLMILLWKPVNNVGASSRRPFPIPIFISMEMAFTPPIINENT
jgi:hypothetical protein